MTAELVLLPSLLLSSTLLHLLNSIHLPLVSYTAIGKIVEL